MTLQEEPSGNSKNTTRKIIRSRLKRKITTWYVKREEMAY